MAEDVAQALKDYAKSRLDRIKEEYERQITKWQGYIDIVADAHTTAYESFKESLKEIKEAQEEERQLAMFALSLIGNVAISWISGLIQYKLYPRLAGRAKWTEQWTLREPWAAHLVSEHHWIKSIDYSQVGAQLFGDIAKQTTGHTLDRLLKPTHEDPPKQFQELELVIDRANFISYKSALTRAVNQEKDRVSKQFTRWSDEIDKNPTYGEQVLEALKKQQPPGRYNVSPRAPAAAVRRQMEIDGYAYLDDYFDKVRELYTQKWFYYQKNPIYARTHFLASHLEREMWALWIAAQEWDTRDVGGESRMVLMSVTKDGGFELPRILLAMRNLAQQELRDVFNEATRTTPEIYKEESGATTKMDGATRGKESVSGDWTSSTNDQPVLDRVLAWAKSNPGQIVYGNLDYRERRLGTLRDINTILADN